MRSSTSSAFFPPALRRRGRASAFCIAVLFILGFTFFYDLTPSFLTEDADRSYLDIHIPSWVKQPAPAPPPSHTGVVDDRPAPGSGDTAVGAVPAIPPTLNTEDGTKNASEPGLPGHDWRDDGLLSVNPEGAHPIYELVRKAEERWEAKQRRASKTLEEAAEEYERRYRRPPPTGFNHWWDYVKKYNVQLPDEYDQIHRDLEPYWGIDPIELQKQQFEWEAHQDIITIGKDSLKGGVTIVNMSKGMEDRVHDFIRWGAKPQMDQLMEVYMHIPPFRAAISPHDNPNMFADWTWKSAATKAAREGKYIKADELPPMDKFGWGTACPPDSPLARSGPRIGETPTPQQTKTFVHNHRLSMDPCLHPQHILMHGQFISSEVDPVPWRFPPPQLSNCGTTLHADIHATSMQQASVTMPDDTRWSDKEDDRLFWRGSPTGLWHRPGYNWWQSQRARLANLTRPSTPELEVGDGRIVFDPNGRVSFHRPTSSPQEPVGIPVERARRPLNAAMMDIGFAGENNNCEGEVCDIINTALPFLPYVNWNEAGRYKYVLDVDGNGWSNRFRRLMSMHSLVFKSTLYPEWWTERAEAWVHYVPVQLDYSDLVDSLVFFAGDLSGEGAHEEMARKIAEAGRTWVDQYWRDQDVTAYMFRLWLEYARVMSPNRNNMNFYIHTKS